MPKLPHRVRPRVPAVDWVFARVQQRVRARSRREAMARAIMRSNLLTVYCLARIQKRTGPHAVCPRVMLTKKYEHMRLLLQRSVWP